MKIKKQLVAATLAVGLAGSGTATALSHEVEIEPAAKIGFLAVYAATRNSSSPVARLGEAAATGAGGAAGGLAMTYIGAKIGGSFGALVGGPVGIVVGTAAGAA